MNKDLIIIILAIVYAIISIIANVIKKRKAKQGNTEQYPAEGEPQYDPWDFDNSNRGHTTDIEQTSSPNYRTYEDLQIEESTDNLMDHEIGITDNKLENSIDFHHKNYNKKTDISKVINLDKPIEIDDLEEDSLRQNNGLKDFNIEEAIVYNVILEPKFKE